MIGKLTEPKHRTAPMLGLFRALTTAVLAGMLADNAFADDLRAAFMAEVLRRLGDLSARLAEVGRLTRLEMVALADRFEIERVYALSDAELREALEKKAEDYRDYKARIEAIDERAAGLGNLKAAARTAAERLDFDEVETLLSRVDEVETEIAADTKVLRAQTALIRGRAEEAFRMLSAAADAFGSLGRIKTAEWRIVLQDQLYTHGLRYGGDGLRLAEKMDRSAIAELEGSQPPNLWGRAHFCLGNALSERGSRLGGTEGVKALEDATDAYIRALRTITREIDAENWGNIKLSLANVLRQRANLASGNRRAGAFHGEAQRFKQIGFRRPCQALPETSRPAIGSRGICAG